MGILAGCTGTATPAANVSPIDGDGEDRFGGSVALSSDGTTAIIGASADEDPNGVDAGSAYVFDASGESWTQQAKLTPVDGNADDRFGKSVAVSSDGTTAIIGSSYDGEPNGREAGSAYVFEVSGGSWTQAAKLTPEEGDADDHFGWAVALSSDGTTAIIGASYDEDPNGGGAGSAYVFEARSGAWTQHAKLTPDDGNTDDHFGWAVAVSSDGTTAVISATDRGDSDGSETRAAYVFETSSGAWTQEAKLTPDDGDSDDWFGVSVSVSGNGTTAIVGASADDDPNGRLAGSAYVFEENGSDWSRQTKIAPDDGDSDDFFGQSVAVSGDGTTTVIGAPTDEDPNTYGAGSAYVFEASGGSWSQQRKLAPGDGDSEDWFGDTIAVSSDGTTVLIGAPTDEDHNGENAGSAYVFTL